ncbi:MAG: M14 family zinc carboxypeptidase [Kofleriaceae bacterium]
MARTLPHRLRPRRPRPSERAPGHAAACDGAAGNRQRRSGARRRAVDRHPQLATRRRLGVSVEGRSIDAIEIGRGGEHKIVLDGGQHAREWVSAMVPMCIADRMLESHDRDDRLRRILSRQRSI